MMMMHMMGLDLVIYYDDTDTRTTTTAFGPFPTLTTVCSVHAHNVGRGRSSTASDGRLAKNKSGRQYAYITTSCVLTWHLK